MKKQSQQKLSEESNVIFLGTTAIRFMLSAVYDENDPLHRRNTYSECGGVSIDVARDPSAGNEVVYVYYHPKDNKTIMTNVEGDIWGFAGSSAGFEGKVALETQKPKNKQ
jgi:hypothetical protein